MYQRYLKFFINFIVEFFDIISKIAFDFFGVINLNLFNLYINKSISFIQLKFEFFGFCFSKLNNTFYVMIILLRKLWDQLQSKNHCEQQIGTCCELQCHCHPLHSSAGHPNNYRPLQNHHQTFGAFLLYLPFLLLFL